MDKSLPGGGAYGRSALANVRNPVLALSATQALLDLPPEQRRLIGTLLRELAADAAERAEISWTRKKGFIAAYWKAVSVYAKHVAHAIDNRSRISSSADRSPSEQND